MADEQVISTPTDAGLGTEQVPSQGSQETAQATQENQNQTASQVETPAQGQQAIEEPRRPSDWFAGRKLSKIERQIANLTQQLQQAQQTWTQPQAGSPKTAPQKYQPTADEIWKDPAAAFQRMMDERMENVQKEIPKALETREAEIRRNQSRQDALKLIKTNDAVKRDPEGEEKVKDILEDENYNLDKIAQNFPLEAARMALEIYNARYGTAQRKSATAPTKAQMVSTATTVNTGGNKVNLNEEALKLQQEAMANPTLLQDPAWVAKVQALKSKRVTEMGQSQA